MSRTLLATLLLALLTPATLGHGGMYRPPGDSGGPGPGGSAGPPTAPGAGNNPVGAPGSPTRPDTGPGSPGGPRAPGRGGTPSATELASDDSFAWDSWVFWWEYNKDRFLTLRDRLGRNEPATRNSVLTQRGRPEEAASARRPAADEVALSVLPVLRGLLATERDRDILDSCVLALARSADEGRDALVPLVAPLLAHAELNVQSTAALSLGVLASRRAVPLLLELSVDSAEGRVAVGGGAVPAQVRSFAILGLGLVGDPAVVGHLADLARRLPDSERDLRVAAITALGLLPEAAREQAVTALAALLGDRRADTVVRAQVPIALARLHATETLPHLLEIFAARDTDDILRQSVAISLGLLGDLAEPQVTSALLDAVAQARDAQTRHFALMALAELGARDAEAAGDHGEQQAALADALARQVTRPAFREQRPWAGLAAAVHARAVPEVAPVALAALRAAWAQSRDPLERGAFALGLGLLEDKVSAPELHAAFAETRDETLKGHLAVALGFLAHDAAREPLRALCAAKATAPTLRLQAATALGLMSDEPAVPVLVGALQDAQIVAVASACARSLGLIGDRLALPALLGLAADEDRPGAARAFAVVALGLLCERGALPWHARLRRDVNYRARSPVLDEVLDIL